MACLPSLPTRFPTAEDSAVETETELIKKLKDYLASRGSRVRLVKHEAE
jgi:hypothetical protein